MTGVELLVTTALPALTVVLAVPLIMLLIPLATAQALVTRLGEGPRAVREKRRLNDSLVLHTLHVDIVEMTERLDRVERDLMIEKGELA